MSPGEIVAFVVALVWVIVSSGYLLFGFGASADSLSFVITLIAIFMPVAMIWIVVATSRSNRLLKSESARLQAAIDGMRESYIEDKRARAQSGLSSMAPSSIEKKLAEIAQSARQTEAALAGFSTMRRRTSEPVATATDPSSIDVSGEAQPTLALGTPAEDIAPPLPADDVIRALNFPDNESDRDGFAALRRALRDRSVRQLVQSSQDVLTLLSQDGIYMDDLRPDRARPEVWRRFARGERGRAVAGLGGVRDRSSLALASGRMREDTVFRDSAHHFLRLFDKMLAGFEPEATDEDLAALSETRTARAFMLLGRVAGTFD